MRHFPGTHSNVAFSLLSPVGVNEPAAGFASMGLDAVAMSCHLSLSSSLADSLDICIVKEKKLRPPCDPLRITADCNALCT